MDGKKEGKERTHMEGKNKKKTGRIEGRAGERKEARQRKEEEKERKDWTLDPVSHVLQHFYVKPIATCSTCLPSPGGATASQHGNGVVYECRHPVPSSSVFICSELPAKNSLLVSECVYSPAD